MYETETEPERKGKRYREREKKIEKDRQTLRKKTRERGQIFRGPPRSEVKGKPESRIQNKNWNKKRKAVNEFARPRLKD